MSAQPTTGSENSVGRAFARLREDDARGLIPFVCGGYPSLEATSETLVALARAGSTLIEVGIPFSDPIADGPTIASAMHRALSNGVTPADVFGAVASARTHDALTGVPVVAMVTASIVWRLGPERFAREARDAGLDGVILPDVPLEGADDFTRPLADAGLTSTLLVAPTTPDERAVEIARACTGFVYMLARVGITGSESPGATGLDALRRRVEMIRAATDVPIAVGFGISTPHDVRAVVREAGADAAIVGSELVKRMTKAGGSTGSAAAAAESLVRSLRVGLR